MPKLNDTLEQLFYGQIVLTVTTNSTGPICSCGWPNKPCARTQTDCQAIRFQESRDA